MNKAKTNRLPSKTEPRGRSKTPGGSKSQGRSKTPGRSKSQGRSKTPNKSSTKESKAQKSVRQAPKGKRNAYMFYSADVREEVRANLVVRHRGIEENVTGKMVTAEVSKRYKNLSEKDFKHYQAMADKDSDRFEKQTQEMEKKGFWVEVKEKKLKTRKRTATKSKGRTASKSKSKGKNASKSKGKNASKKSDKK